MHHPEFGSGREVSIETPPDHFVETLRSVDVGDRNDHDFELDVYEIPLARYCMFNSLRFAFASRTFPLPWTTASAAQLLG